MDLMQTDTRTALRLQDIKRLNNGKLKYKQIEPEQLEKAKANNPYGNLTFRDIEADPIDADQFGAFIEEVIAPSLLQDYFGVYDITGFDQTNAEKAATVVQKLKEDKTEQAAEKLNDDYFGAYNLMCALREYETHFAKTGKQNNCNFNAVISLVQCFGKVAKGKAEIYSLVKRSLVHSIAHQTYEVPVLITKENILEFILTYPVIFGNEWESNNGAKNQTIPSIREFIIPFSEEYSRLLWDIYCVFSERRRAYQFISEETLDFINHKDSIPFDALQFLEQLNKEKLPTGKLNIGTPYFELVADYPTNIDPILFTWHKESGCIVALRRWSATGAFAHAIDMIADTMNFLRVYQERNKGNDNAPNVQPILDKYEAGTLFTDYHKLFTV